MPLELRSRAFRSGGQIPVHHTCLGADRSPPLSWSGVPTGARSLVLIMDDLDGGSGPGTHWIVYGIPPDVTALPEGVPHDQHVPGVGFQGVNDFQRVGWAGPCPSRGRVHRYAFILYALDAEPHLPPRLTKAEVLAATDGHVMARAALLARYRR